MDVGSTEYHLADKITVSCRHKDNFGEFGSCGMNLTSKDQGMFDRVKHNQIQEAHTQTLGHTHIQALGPNMCDKYQNMQYQKEESHRIDVFH